MRAVSVPAFPSVRSRPTCCGTRRPSRDLLGASLWFGVILLGWATGTLAFVLAGSVVVNYSPQVLTAIHGRDLDGLAPATWFLALADTLLWGAYGLAVGDPALMGYCVVLLTSATIILVRITQTRHREPILEPTRRSSLGLWLLAEELA